MTRYDDFPDHPLHGVPQEALDAAENALRESLKWDDSGIDEEQIMPIAHAVLMEGLKAFDVKVIEKWKPGDGDTKCQDCHQPYQPWFTDNWIWNLVMGGPEAESDPGGYACPRCFAIRFEKVFANQVWRFIPEWTPKYQGDVGPN